LVSGYPQRYRQRNDLAEHWKSGVATTGSQIVGGDQVLLFKGSLEYAVINMHAPWNTRKSMGQVGKIRWESSTVAQELRGTSW
jgi:hypothetical protein